MKVALVLLVLLLGGVLVEGERPELVGSSVWYSPNATLLNTNFDLAIVQMDFDQPLYTNGHSFLCPESDQECPPLSCKACDWSVQEPTGCGDPTCCGPAQNGDMEKAEEWCSDEGPVYETLPVGGTSRRITLLKGETMYVRFFIPEDMYCHSIVLVPRPYYGTLSWSFSTLEAYPEFSTVTGWRNGLAGDQKTFAYGQTGALFCPNTTLHPEYNVGTYSGMLYGLTETSFEIEIQVSPQKYPLPEPKERFPCSDVPSDVLDYAGTHDPALCIDDGASKSFAVSDAGSNGQISLVLPVPKGCHTLSFSSASEIPTPISHRLYCLPSQTNTPRDVGNVCMFKFASSGQTSVLSACFEEEVTYVICTLRLFFEQPVHFSFSSVSKTMRKNILEVPDASLSYMEGLQAAFGVTFGQPKYACFDYYTNCFDYTVTPSDDTLFLFPPPASAEVDSDETYEDLQEFYRNAGLATKKENRLSMVVVFQAGTLSLIVKNISSMSIAITSLSNKDGEPVSLPGGGVDLNPDSEKQYSIANYVPHIPLKDIPDLEFSPCDYERYTIYRNVVQERLEAVSKSKTLDGVLALEYSLDVMNEALLAQTCENDISSNLNVFTTDVILLNTVDCRHPFGTIQYWADPCCNVFLSLVSCCTPFDYNATVTNYGTDADVSACSEEACATSYYEDLSFSLNNLEDASLGCTSGIQNPMSSLAVMTSNAIQAQYIVCLDAVGLGEFYKGTSCQIDSDCDHLQGKCYEGKCALAPLEQLENDFLDCYIDQMPSPLESYLKRNIFFQEVDGDKNSTEFYEALKQAATVPDCVYPSDPLAISHRSRYQSQPLNKACVSDSMGLGWPNDDFEDICPGDSCLRSFGCLINVSSCVYEYCDGFTQNYIGATEESCPIDPSECGINLDDDCEGFYCVYCPPNGDRPCQKVEGYTTQEECEAAFACELPDGSLDFTLTEEECRNEGTGCTTDCIGQSCGSVYEKNGGCFVPSITTNSSCLLYSNDNGVETEWFKDELCALENVSEDECGLLPSTSWSTCQENDLDSCNESTTTQQYLGCYVSKWRECRDQDECEASGQCTDRQFYARVTSYDPAEVVYGACISSGDYATETKPFCGVLSDLTSIGCIFTTINYPADCVVLNPFIISTWIEVAETKEECLAPTYGRRGCQLYQDPADVLLWILDPEQCTCRGGVLLDQWEWIPGEWRGGVARQLEWKEAQQESSYVFKDALSFILLAEWIKESTEEQFLYPLQSQIICESQSISTPLYVLACDCTEDGGENCYNSLSQDKELQMGLSQACEGEEVFVKDPSAQVTFSEDSIKSGCTFLDIKIIYQNFFSAPYVPPPLSFKWQNPKEQGVVINQKETTVGEILGDGLVLSFSDPSSVRAFDVCLRLGQEASYDVPDFGYSTEDLEWIYPLGLDNVKFEERGVQGSWYCVSSLKFEDVYSQDGTIRIFPIARVEDYEDKDDDYTDKTTRVLCYVLGASYCFVGFLCVLGLLLFFQRGLITGKTLLSLPNFCTASFLVLCVFRAVFMFLYPQGTFEFQPLSYFVIFEIPTFILFSVVIFMIYSFKRLVYKRGFFPGNPTPILAIGWTFVWGMWMVVIIVYSEVILEDDAGSSPCEGRVQVSYDNEEEATRTLSIAYQSVIVGVTFLLASIFFYYTFLMYKNTKNKKSAFKQFIIFVSGSFNISFFTRTVLLIIILAVDFASSIYLFCTFFITEVMMITILLFQFNIRYLRNFADRNSSSTSRTTTSRSTNNNINRSTHASTYEVDD